ncbi:hypothetical protein HZH66_011782 [Vespula vulgaris]|uniref:Uncharacterized protein n=1 Tax=Vespula vulgaris TaxID=7454 RepID=A0A834MVF5_VESVU|nr:hypothetical protein HZH66_011782 [Vespula vulgaris]
MEVRQGGVRCPLNFTPLNTWKGTFRGGEVNQKPGGILLRRVYFTVRFEQRTMDEKGYEEYTKMLLDVASSYIQHEVFRARAHPNYTRFGRDLEPLFPHQFRSYPNRGVECTTIVITTTNTNAITNTDTTTLIPAMSSLLTP